MQTFLIGFAALMVLVPTAQGQALFLGRCPKVTVMKNFTVEKYLGLWYEQKKYFSAYIGGACVTATYTLNKDQTIAVEDRQYLLTDKRWVSAMGIATLAGSSGDGRLTVTYPKGGNSPGEYLILGTDYTTYSVVWSCKEVSVYNFQSSWVLTRDRFPFNSTAVLAKADSVLLKNNIYLPSFKNTTQNDTACFPTTTTSKPLPLTF